MTVSRLLVHTLVSISDRASTPLPPEQQHTHVQHHQPEGPLGGGGVEEREPQEARRSR